MKCTYTLIQELVDANVELEELYERLERLLNASPQPCLIGFVKVRNCINIFGLIFMFFFVSVN